MRNLIILSGVLLTVVAVGAELNIEGSFTGKLGKKLGVALVLEQATGGVLSGRYFYIKKGIDIPLRGKITEKKFVLEETDGTWTGTTGDEYLLKGTWLSKDGKKSFPFEVTRARFGYSSIEELRPHPTGKPILGPGHKYHHERWVQKQKNGKIEKGIRLAMYPDGAIQKKVNAALGAASEDSAAIVRFADREIFSVERHVSYDGTNHSINDEKVSMNFDLKTGKEVKFSNLFQNYDASKEAIQKIIAKFLPTARGNNYGPSACREHWTEEELSEFPAYYFLGQNIVIQSTFPHALEVCDFAITLPAKELLTFASPTSLLRRVAE